LFSVKLLKFSVIEMKLIDEKMRNKWFVCGWVMVFCSEAFITRILKLVNACQAFLHSDGSDDLKMIGQVPRPSDA